MTLSWKQRLAKALRSWPGQTLKLAASLSLASLLIYQVGTSSILNAMQSAHWCNITLATAVILLGVIALQAYEIQHSLSVETRPTLWRIGRINLAMMFYAFFLPTAMTFAIRWAKYRALGLESWHSATLVGVHKLLQLMVALLFFVVSYTAFPIHTHPGIDVFLGVLLATLVVLFGFFGWLTLRPRLKIFPDFNPHSSTVLMKAKSGMEKLRTAIRTFQTLPASDKWRCAVFALLQHVCVIVSAYLVLSAIAPEASWLAVTVIRSLLVILLFIPLSIAGIGVRELIFFTLFPFYGVSAEDALAASLVLLGIQLFIALLGAFSELQYRVMKVHQVFKDAHR